MIELRTGLPGAGKTLSALAEWSKQAAKDSRQVYYIGIPDLKVPGWQQWDIFSRWTELPEGSILVVDEAQDHMPGGRMVKDEPGHISELSRHRHYGVDLVLITQHPKLISAHVRRLVGKHVHIRRLFGSFLYTRFQWEKAADPDDKWSFKDAQKSIRPYARKFFNQYKSATLHTAQGGLPWGVIGMFGACVLGLWLLGSGLVSMYKRVSGQEQAQQQTQAALQQAATSVQAAASQLDLTAQLLAQWANRFSPRIDELPWSAPLYDGLMEPTDAPVLVGCMHIQLGRREICQCQDQQGNRYPTPLQACRQFVRNGEFDWTGRRSAAIAATARGEASEAAKRGAAPPAAASPTHSINPFSG